MASGFDLIGHHRETLEQIFGHPLSHNIEWHDVLSLLESIGTAVEERNGRIRVEVGSETETFDRPKEHGTIDAQQVVDLRHMLQRAGVVPDDGS